MADRSYDPHPPVGFHFSVQFGLDGAKRGDCRFRDVSGLAAEISTEEVAEGGENRFSHRLPGRVKYSNLVLRRGLVSDSKVIDWIRDAVENFVFAPTTIQVLLLGEDHQPLMSWGFANAYPVKWSASDLKAQENSIVIETLELAYQYFRKV